MVADGYRQQLEEGTAAGGFLRRLGLAAFLGVAAAGAATPNGGLAEAPLTGRPHPRGPTMFAEMTAAETGLKTENRYADPRMWGDLYQEFEGGSIGTGVAVGDYDGDGRPDIFVVSKTESCRLFRNLGDYKFEDVTDRAGVGDTGPAAMVWKGGVSFVDVNNDGLLDIYVCRFNAPNLLYINQGNGTFKEMAHASGLDVTDASVMASFCDYDRDGWLDVYLTTNLLNNSTHPNGQRGYLFHNNRDGTFTNVTDAAGITGESQSHSATWWDFDNDGWPDLYVANDYGLPDRLYRNNRDGTFTDVINQVLPHTSHYSMGSDLGDVNNDGLIDFIAADMAATSHIQDQRSIAEARARMEDPPDGLVVAPKYHRTALYLNTGTGRCLEAAYLAGIAASDWTWSVRLEDLDNDGRVDLYITNGFNRDPDPDRHKLSMSAETTADRIRVMYESPVLVQTHLAFRNLGDLHFENVGAKWGLDQRGVAFGAAFGDLNDDGNLDLLYSNYQAPPTLMRNDCDTGHRVKIYLRGTVSNRFGIGAKVGLESASGIQAQQLWLARGYMSCSEPMLHFGLGADTLIKRLTVTWPSGHVQSFDNLPVDRRFTITEPSGPLEGSSPDGPRAGRSGDRPSTGSPLISPVADGRGVQFAEVSQSAGLALTSREELVDETYVQKLAPIRLNRRGPGLAIGALDDGSDIVAVGGTTMTRASLLMAASKGQFAAADTSALLPVGAVDDGPVLLFDADGDGKTDLLITKGGNALPAGAPEYQPRLYLGDGRGGFRPAAENALPQLSISAGAVAAADFLHDGRLGVFLGARLRPGDYPLPPTSALLANRGGRFEDVTDALAPGLREVGMVTAALWSDVDGDGWPDLLLALDWGQVKCFHNNQGKGFEDWTEKLGFAAAGTGWWTSLATADFNGDGRPDFVVGNVGLNTPYSADPARPALLFSGDFRGDGSNQLIEAYYEGDKLYPWRSRRSLAAALPVIMKRFPKNDTYARATVGEIVGEAKLAKARRFAATELRSGVFLSQSDGAQGGSARVTYRFEPLPRIAQISPLQGVVAGDFDGDGCADIYAVQNSYAPIPSVGRYDTGLSQLLRGDGHGHFTPAPPSESGLVVPGDAKALAVLDLDGDGWPDFVVSRNNSTTLAFRNQGVAGRASLRVVLRGPVGNPTAVGARITVGFADGSTQTAEVQAGSGYYSQSSAAGFFGHALSNPPKTIRVRWPTGAVTLHEPPAASSTVVISALSSSKSP